MGRQSARARAEAQRPRNEANRVNRNFDNFSVAFDNDMRGLDYSVCSTCNKRVSRTDIVRDSCVSCRRTRGPIMFSAENNMDIGEIPDELRGLTMIEEILIARVHPVVSVFKIRGQQRAYSGHVMNFVQHVEDIATRLPHDPRGLNTIVLLNRNTPNGMIQFRVRSSNVRVALCWLKENNQYYRDIIIDENVLRNLPRDGDVSHLLPNIPGADQPVEDPNQPLDNLLDIRICPKGGLFPPFGHLETNRISLKEGIKAKGIEAFPNCPPCINNRRGFTSAVGFIVNQ